MPLHLVRVPYQPYIWGRVFDDNKEIGAINNRTGNFEILVKGGNGNWIPFNIQSSNLAMLKCRELYNALQEAKRETERGVGHVL